MRTVFLNGDGTVSVEEVPQPIPGTHQLLIEVRAAGICGSDLHLIRGDNPWSGGKAARARGGHELAGKVTKVGEGVDSSLLGRRIAVRPLQLSGCGDCPSCVAGSTQLCSNRRSLAKSAGFSEFDLADARCPAILPDQISFAEGSLIDVYACAVHAINRLQVRAADTVAVVGTGPIGIATGQVARAVGARVIVVARHNDSAAFALRVGAADDTWISGLSWDLHEEQTRSADVVFEAVGDDGTALRTATEIVKKRGRVGILGAFVGDIRVPFPAAVSKELELRLCTGYALHGGRSEYLEALEMMVAGRVRAAPLITHRFPIAKAQEAFDTARRRRQTGAMKVIIEPHRGEEVDHV